MQEGPSISNAAIESTVIETATGTVASPGTDSGPISEEAPQQQTLVPLPEPIDLPTNLNDLLPAWHIVPSFVDNLMSSTSFDVHAKGSLKQDIGSIYIIVCSCCR
jgi:hypothetical protein